MSSHRRREDLVSGTIAFAALSAALCLRLMGLDAASGGRVAAFEASKKRVSASPEALGVLSAEHALAAADAVWLTIVQEFGKAIERKPIDDEAVYRWARVATDLDPLYLTVYYAVSVNLTVYARRVDESDALLEKGRAHVPSAWQLPFMMGYNAYFIRGDATAAYRHWLEASQLERAPPFLLSLASRARYQAGDANGAQQMLLDMMPHLPGPARQDAEMRLKAFRSEPILSAYDSACQAYLLAHGVLPSSAEQLREQGLVDPPPFDLFKQPIVLDENCRARTKFILVREDEAKKNLGRLPDAPNYLDLIQAGQ